MKDLEHIRNVKREHAFSLLTKAKVVGVGIGQKEVQGKPTETVSISVLVEKKIRKCLLPTEDVVPSDLNGIPTDVIPFSHDKTCVEARLRQSRLPEDDRTKRCRPAPVGVSVAHYLSKGAGTLGAWVRDSRSGEPLLLSNWHVIANMGDCKKGDPILQPAVLDGGKGPDDIIAYLERWIDVQMIVSTGVLDDARQRLKGILESRSRVPTNKVDLALAKPISDAVVSSEILGIASVHWPGTFIANLDMPGTFSDEGDSGSMVFQILGTKNGHWPGSLDREPASRLGTEVIKSGRTTGVTRGRCNLVDLDVFVSYPRKGIALFVGQLRCVGS